MTEWQLDPDSDSLSVVADDEKKFSVEKGDGVEVEDNRFIISDSKPTDVPVGTVWVDISNSGANMKMLRERSWIDISSTPSPKGVTGDWNLIIQDEFNDGSLNTDLWGINGGETKDPINDDANTNDDLVIVSDDTCKLQVVSEGTGADGVTQGPISTYPGNESFHADIGFKGGNDPGLYVESRIKLSGPRNGILPAFWMNPFGSSAWPPEIDIVEIFQTSQDPDTSETSHSVHWTSSGQAGDIDNHVGVGRDYDNPRKMTDEMHVYGSAWFKDRVEFYIDGVHIATHDLMDMVRTMNDPDRNDMYIKFTQHVNRVGSADLQSAWTEEMEVDYVRVWEFDGKPPEAPTMPSFTTIDNFDGGTIASGWNDLDGAWTTTTNYAQSGSASLTNTATGSAIGWEGTPSFEPYGPGTTIEYDFALSDTSSRLNTRFGANSTSDTVSYRLDILNNDLFLFETDGWNSMHHDSSFSISAPFEFHTARIEFTGNNILYEVESPAGDVLSTHAAYDSLDFDGAVPSFSVETGTAYVDEVRIATNK